MLRQRAIASGVGTPHFQELQTAVNEMATVAAPTPCLRSMLIQQLLWSRRCSGSEK
jgi:hypothetical protein